MTSSFIEVQFPVSKVSKESYKERKAVAGQTLTGLGKWWGRKPLILVRATLLGLLLPSSDDPRKDREIFLKILTMDEEGLLLRKDKPLPLSLLDQFATPAERERYFDPEEGWKKGVTREEKKELDNLIFSRDLNYDQKLEYCRRPEQIEGPSESGWEEINQHLGTHATTLQELVAELGQRQFGHLPRVGDAFCGGGSIPFEAARIGCEAFGSDLNPAAALLTWAALNIVGGGPEVHRKVKEAQEEVFNAVDRQITEWAIEHNELGWRADAYLYCVEVTSPKSGYRVPLAPSWIISEKYRVCAVPEPDHANKRYRIRIVTGATGEVFEKARKGTIADSVFYDPMAPETGIPVSTLRGDRVVDGKTIYGLRMWENDDLVPRPEDIFQERLYCIRYIETFYTVKKDFSSGNRSFRKGEVLSPADFAGIDHPEKHLANGTLKEDFNRHFIEPTPEDLNREEKVLQLVRERFKEWQEMGFVPSMKIIPGYNTEQPIRERGWTYWHHLFNSRQLLIHGTFNQTLSLYNYECKITCLLVPKMANWNSRLTQWLQSQGGGIGGGKQTFANQALNTLYNYSCRPFHTLTSCAVSFPEEPVVKEFSITSVNDARILSIDCDFWITDPPYADAVNYHELADYFLAWYEKSLKKLFPEWYTDSKSALAIKGTGKNFNQSMVECYRNFTAHMPDSGAQVVMFTHQDAAVWADLALILWASGLQVTAAWTIQTETDATGIKKGNYVQGTVIMVLRKQTSMESAFLSDIQVDVEVEVKEQIRKMLSLDDNDDPNFGDTDYQLAAYVAALRVITGYGKIEDVDVAWELERERRPGVKSELQQIIENAVKIAMNELVPAGFSSQHWRRLSPDERFYLKGLDLEYKGEYRNGVYQEMARGFGVREYRSMLNTAKANQTRLFTPFEYGTKDLSGDGFGNSLVRNILFAVRETMVNDDPQAGRNWLFTELNDFYWEKRELMMALFRYIDSRCHFLEQWKEDIAALTLLAGRIENDHI